MLEISSPEPEEGQEPGDPKLTLPVMGGKWRNHRSPATGCLWKPGTGWFELLVKGIEDTWVKRELLWEGQIRVGVRIHTVQLYSFVWNAPDWMSTMSMQTV